MPRLDRDPHTEGPVVQAFSGAGYRVDTSHFSGGIKLTPRAATAWDATDVDQLAPEDLDDLLALDPAPEFILLGTGPTLRRPKPALVRHVEACGIGLEVMDSRAAARAWAVLRAEDRWIAAALLPHGQE